jgi:hypothetical protein
MTLGAAVGAAVAWTAFLNGSGAGVGVVVSLTADRFVSDARAYGLALPTVSG